MKIVITIEDNIRLSVVFMGMRIVLLKTGKMSALGTSMKITKVLPRTKGIPKISELRWVKAVWKDLLDIFWSSPVVFENICIRIPHSALDEPDIFGLLALVCGIHRTIVRPSDRTHLDIVLRVRARELLKIALIALRYRLKSRTPVRTYPL